jgi:phospholipase/carboxylesterase/glyoxalase family protein
MSPAQLSFIHRYLPAERPDAPTLLLLHGTGGDENDLLKLGRLLAPGAALLSPRGKVVEGTMPRFFRRLAEGVFDLEDLRVRTHELADFAVGAAAAYGFDPRRITAVGYSNGANIAASLLLTRPGALAGAVLFHAQVPFEPRETPNLLGIPIFLTGGRADPIVRPAQTERLAVLLREAGADLSLWWQPGGHALASQEVEEARRWLTTQLTRGRDATGNP